MQIACPSWSGMRGIGIADGRDYRRLPRPQTMPAHRTSGCQDSQTMQRPNGWQATHPGTIIDFSYSCHTTQFATTPGKYVYEYIYIYN